MNMLKDLENQVDKLKKDAATMDDVNNVGIEHLQILISSVTAESPCNKLLSMP